MSASRRGGARQGGGRKSSWVNQPTCTVRVPVVFSQLILEIAKELDHGAEDEIIVNLKSKALIHQTKRPKLLLSDVQIYSRSGQPVVRLQDVLRVLQAALEADSK